MKKYYSIYILLVCLLFCVSTKAQDPHFSQPGMVPILSNPAYTGLFPGLARLSMIYRNQWATVSNPYQTYALGVEIAPLKRVQQRDGFGIGLNFLGDIAGTSRYGSMEGDLSLSYFKSLNRRQHHFLSFGLQVGYGQAGFSTQDLEFPEGGSLESFDNTRVSYPTFGAGVAWQYQAQRELFFQAGISAFHLNSPKLDYFGNDGRVYPKFVADVQTQWRFQKSLAAVPSVYAQFQHNAFEIIYGSDIKWFIDESRFRYFTASAGLYFRQSDAVVVSLKSEYNAWQFALNYDTNISKLRKSSKTIGAFEIAVVYIFKKKTVLQRYEIPCPVF